MTHYQTLTIIEQITKDRVCGLCYANDIAYDLKYISAFEHNWFIELIDTERFRKNLNKEWFFNCFNERTRKDKQFFWRMGNEIGRLAWVAEKKKLWAPPFIHEIKVYLFCNASPYGVHISKEDLDRYQAFVPGVKAVKLLDPNSGQHEWYKEEYLVELEKLLGVPRTEIYTVYEVGVHDEISLEQHLIAPYVMKIDVDCMPKLLVEYDGHCEQGVLLLK